MKERGTVLVPTTSPASQRPANAQQRIDALSRAYQSGVTLVFGTDVLSDFPGLTRGEAMMEYLDSWRAAGVSPTAILKAMSTDAAALLRIEKQRGALSAGFAADIVAAPTNPLMDIDALKKLNFVMKDGVIVTQRGPRTSGGSR